MTLYIACDKEPHVCKSQVKETVLVLSNYWTKEEKKSFSKAVTVY